MQDEAFSETRLFLELLLCYFNTNKPLKLLINFSIFQKPTFSNSIEDNGFLSKYFKLLYFLFSRALHLYHELQDIHLKFI